MWDKKIARYIGLRFYFDWLLPTNPVTKNKLYRLFWDRRDGRWITDADVSYRLHNTQMLGYIHLFSWIVILPSMFHSIEAIIVNLFVNGYPVICQVWIGYRCMRVKIIRTKLRLGIIT